MTASNPIENLQLREKHRTALQEALDSLYSIAEPLGVVVSGSIVRGNPGPSSDLDIVVLHGQPWRRRIQRWFNGTPVELFFNSREWLDHCIRDEAVHGRPVMAHMLSTGTLIVDVEGQMTSVIETARKMLGRGPCMSADALLRSKYAAACLVEDALDSEGVDSADGRQLLASAVEAVVSHAYGRQNQFLPRPKERLALLASIEPEAARLLSRALTEPFPGALRALQQAADHVLGCSGFFEWDSGQDNALPPPGR
ncbi:nucleotidyltransferase domain-containing protein [soil metagenome]